jgi:hypothetical protein
MTKKLIVALALLLSATSVTLAKSRAFYDYSHAAQCSSSYTPNPSANGG